MQGANGHEHEARESLQQCDKILLLSLKHMARYVSETTALQSVRSSGDIGQEEVVRHVYSEMDMWTRGMLKLFSDLLQASQYSEDSSDSKEVRSICTQSARILEPMVRCLVEWVKKPSDGDPNEIDDMQALQYVQKQSNDEAKNNSKRSLI